MRALAAAVTLLLASGCAGLTGEGGAGSELPAPVRQVLPNGLRLIVQDHRAADIVAVYLYVGVGVRYERPDQLGYSHFQEHMLFKGTDKWGPGYIDRTVEGVGGRTNATTSFGSNFERKTMSARVCKAISVASVGTTM